MKHPLPLLAAALAAAPLAGCAAPPHPFAAQATPVGIATGVHVGKLVAVPQVMVEDSRCPINARCIQAGRAVLSTRIYGPGIDETVPLTLGQPYGTHGTSITLVSAEPGKTAGQSTPMTSYRFTFEGGE